MYISSTDWLPLSVAIRISVVSTTLSPSDMVMGLAIRAMSPNRGKQARKRRVHLYEVHRNISTVEENTAFQEGYFQVSI